MTYRGFITQATYRVTSAPTDADVQSFTCMDVWRTESLFSSATTDSGRTSTSAPGTLSAHDR